MRGAWYTKGTFRDPGKADGADSGIPGVGSGPYQCTYLREVTLCIMVNCAALLFLGLLLPLPWQLLALWGVLSCWWRLSI